MGRPAVVLSLLSTMLAQAHNRRGCEAGARREKISQTQILRLRVVSLRCVKVVAQTDRASVILADVQHAVTKLVQACLNSWPLRKAHGQGARLWIVNGSWSGLHLYVQSIFIDLVSLSCDHWSPFGQPFALSMLGYLEY